IFVKISLTVAVQIVQARDLVAAEDEDLPVADFQAERLEQARGKTFPAQIAEIFVNSGHAPKVPVNGANVSGPIGREVNAGEKHQRLPRVVIRQGQGSDGQKLGL